MSFRDLTLRSDDAVRGGSPLFLPEVGSVLITEMLNLLGAAAGSWRYAQSENVPLRIRFIAQRAEFDVLRRCGILSDTGDREVGGP